MLLNPGEVVRATGGVARFQPRLRSVELSSDLAASLGWNGPREVSVASFLHPEDRDTVFAAINAISAGDLPGALSRSRVSGRDGQCQTFNWSFYRDPDPDVVCGVGMLVADRERIDRSSLLEEVVEDMHDGFAIYDPDDRLILSNQAFRSVLPEFDPAMLHGLEFAQIAEICRDRGVYDDVISDSEKYLVSRIKAHQSGNSVIFQTLRSGRVERIEERRLPSGHIVALHADVTGLHRESVASSRKASATLDFVSVISHELRTPLVGLLGMMDELSEAKTKGERTRILQIMRQSGDHLMNIANTALDLTKIEEGRMQLDQVPFDPAASLRAVIERYALIAKKKGVEFTANLAPDIGLRRGDPMKFTQVVENLLSNAVKFTAKGKVELSLLKGSGHMILMEVADTGIGIDPSFISQMMKPFTQADPTLTRQYGGTGLGLSVVSNLVKLMGGTVSCTSHLGQGATFTVHLPLRPAPQPRMLDAPTKAAESVSFAGKRVLIADDNEVNRIVMENYFKWMRFDTTLAADGEDALNQALGQTFDLVVLDISMPKVDGIEVLYRLRQTKDYAHSPILAVTANVLPHEIAAYKEAGFDSCITKPFRRQDLAKVVAQVLTPNS